MTQLVSAATGGTINGPGGVTLVVPGGALDTDTSITVALDSTGAPPLPAGITAGSPVISLTPSGLTFAKPVVVSMPIDPAVYPAGVTPSVIQTNLAGDGWEQVAGTRSADRVGFAMTHFTYAVTPGVCPSTCPPPALSIVATGPRNATGDVEVAEGGWAGFRVEATYPTLISAGLGGTYFSYQWQRNGRRVAGAINERTIIVNPASLDDAGEYTVVVTVRRLDDDTDVASAVSPAARLVVAALPPVIVNHPRDVEYSAGDSARLLSASTSSLPHTVQWKRCDPGLSCPANVALWNDEPRATMPLLVLRNLTAAADGTVFAMCALNDVDIGDVSRVRCSNTARLLLRPAPVMAVIVSLVEPGPLLPGDSASFTVNATGTDLHYDWQRQDAGTTRWISQNVDAATFTISNVVAADDGALFRVLVSNSVNTARSNESAPLVILPGANLVVRRVLAGDDFSVALGGDGRIHTWGRGCDGALGVGNLADVAAPSPIAGLAGVVNFSVGSGHVLTLDATGAPMAWGDNHHGQTLPSSARIEPTCADVSPSTQRALDWVPTALNTPGLSSLSDVAAGAFHSMALSSTGDVLSWGGDGVLALGDGTLNSRRADSAVSSISEGLRIAAASYASAVVTRNGQLWIWGEGGVGDGSTMARLRPTPVVTPGAVADVALGQHLAVVLLRDGRVFTWGQNSGTPTEKYTLRQLSLPTYAVGLAVHGGHALFLLSTGEVYAWGANSRGQLGTGNTGSVNVPVPVPGLPPVVAIGTGRGHSLGMASNGTVWGWGANSFGQATGTPGPDVLSPQQIPAFNLN